MPSSNDDSRNGPRSLWIFLAGLALLILLQLPWVLDPAAEMAPPLVEKVYISATPPAPVTQIVTLTPGKAIATTVPKQTRMAIYATTAAVSRMRSPTVTRTHPPTVPPQPTRTINPSSTLRPEEQATMGWIQKLTSEARDQYATQVAEFPLTCDNERGLISPRGNWLARPCVDKHDQTLQILDQSGVKWELDIKDFIRPEEANAMVGLYPMYWTHDDVYLYFSSYVNASGGGTCFYGFGWPGLFRFNTTDGTWTTVLGIQGDWWEDYRISFSPFGRHFVYALDFPILVDYITGEEVHLGAAGGVAGSFVWSPDGSELAYAYCRASEDYETIEESGIRIYSLQSGSTRTIVQAPGNFFNLFDQDRGDRLKIAEWDMQHGEDLYADYDWSTGQLTSFTP
jgi:hypothetical protein